MYEVIPGALPEVSIAEVLQVHDQYSQTEMSIEKSLLDGLVLHLSPIAKHVRHIFLNQGFTYSLLNSANDQHYFYQKHYFLLPELQIRKAIPYRNSVDALRLLVKNYPYLNQVPANSIVRIDQYNKLLHESMHLICFKKFLSQKMNYKFDRNLNAAESLNWVLTHIAIEAIVLTTELISTVVDKPGAMSIYALTTSCHQSARYPIDTQTITDARLKIGKKNLFFAVARGFLTVNLRPYELNLNEDDKKHILSFLDPDFDLKELLNRSIQVTQIFRRDSNNRYFTSIGFPELYSDAASKFEISDCLNSSIVQEIFEFGYETFFAQT